MLLSQEKISHPVVQLLSNCSQRRILLRTVRHHFMYCTPTKITQAVDACQTSYGLFWWELHITYLFLLLNERHSDHEGTPYLVRQERYRYRPLRGFQWPLSVASAAEIRAVGSYLHHLGAAFLLKQLELAAILLFILSIAFKAWMWHLKGPLSAHVLSRPWILSNSSILLSQWSNS